MLMFNHFVSVHFVFKSEITLIFFCRMKYKIPPISGVARLFGGRGELIRTAALPEIFLHSLTYSV
jgi:hypothetical protein